MTAGPITLQAEYHKTTLGVHKPDARGRDSQLFWPSPSGGSSGKQDEYEH